jgi:hypothetical protein
MPGRDSTVPDEQQLERKAAQYAQQHPNGAPPKRHRLIDLVRRALHSLRRSGLN